METNGEILQEIKVQPLPEIINSITEKYDRILSYHNSDHTRKVVERASLIGQVLELTERQLELLQIAGSFHDFVSDFRIDEIEIEYQGKKLKIKKRFMNREDNEKRSAEEAEKWMKEKGRYSEEEIALVKEAILATIPGWHKEKETVYQPRLNKNSHPLIRALCLADIGTSGMNVNDCKKDPFKLFLEDYPDFHEFILGKRKLSDEEKDFYLDQFRKFMSAQVNFIKGRQEFFENEIEGEGIDGEKKDKLRKLFHDFENSSQSILNLVEMINQEDFNSLARRFRNLYINSS